MSDEEKYPMEGRLHPLPQTSASRRNRADSSPETRRPGRAGRWLGLALVLSALNVQAQPALKAPTAQAQRQAGIAALERGDLKKAQRDLESSFLREPDPALYELLGQVAERSGDPIAAADLYRRFLEELPDTSTAHLRLSQLIAAVQAGAAEVAVSSRESAAFLRVDGRLVGRLPFSRPLLLSPGQHTLSYEKDGRTAPYTLPVQAGIPLALHFEPDSPHVAFEKRPAVILVVFAGRVQPGPDQTMLARAVLTGLRRDGQAYDLAPERIRSAAAEEGCFADHSCLTQLARRLEAHGVLLVSSDAQPLLTYLDARAGVVSERSEVACAGCTSERLADAAQQRAHELILRAINRGHGVLEVRTQPGGAELTVAANNAASQTPAKFPVLAGSVLFTVRKSGYLPLRAQVDVPVEEVRAIDLLLRPNQAAIKRRRVAMGKWVLLTAGLLGVAGGIIGIALHNDPGLDRPVEGDLGNERFQSLPQGVTFLTLGLAAVGGTVGLAVYERMLTKQARADEASSIEKMRQL